MEVVLQSQNNDNCNTSNDKEPKEVDQQCWGFSRETTHIDMNWNTPNIVLPHSMANPLTLVPYWIVGWPKNRLVDYFLQYTCTYPIWSGLSDNCCTSRNEPVQVNKFERNPVTNQRVVLPKWMHGKVAFLSRHWIFPELPFPDVCCEQGKMTLLKFYAWFN